jgi:Holliday junction resolvasome RuvABC endonuclease subunit
VLVVLSIVILGVAMSESLRYFLGIDPSATCSGVTLLCDSDETKSETHLITPGYLRDADRLKYIHESLLKIISGKNIIRSVMESPSYGSVHKEFILGEVLGSVKLTLAMKGIAVDYAAPLQLKKFLTGNSKATKEEMVTAAISRGCNSSIHDICDSWAAALIAKSLEQKKTCLFTRASEEVVQAILQK